VSSASSYDIDWTTAQSVLCLRLIGYVTVTCISIMISLEYLGTITMEAEKRASVSVDVMEVFICD
jgi:hypothetical protein